MFVFLFLTSFLLCVFVFSNYTVVLYMYLEKKTNAEHGAAARAYDCFSHRHYFGTSMRSVHLGHDAPYLVTDKARQHEPTSLPPPLPSTPTDIDEKIALLVHKYRERTQVLEWNEGVERMMDEQNVDDPGGNSSELMATDEYRQTRRAGGSLSE